MSCARHARRDVGRWETRPHALLRWAADGRRQATESLSPTVKIYDAQLRLLESFTPPTAGGLDQTLLQGIGTIEALATMWLPARQELAVATADRRVASYVFNVKLKKWLRMSSLTVPEPIAAMAWYDGVRGGGVDGLLFCSPKSGVRVSAWQLDEPEARRMAVMASHRKGLCHSAVAALSV